MQEFRRGKFHFAFTVLFMHLEVHKIRFNGSILDVFRIPFLAFAMQSVWSDREVPSGYPD